MKAFVFVFVFFFYKEGSESNLMSCSNVFIFSYWINVGKGLRTSMLIRHPEVQGRRGTLCYGEKSVFVFVLAHPPVYVVQFRTCILAVNYLDESRDWCKPAIQMPYYL